MMGLIHYLWSLYKVPAPFLAPVRAYSVFFKDPPFPDDLSGDNITETTFLAIRREQKCLKVPGPPCPVLF